MSEASRDDRSFWHACLVPGLLCPSDTPALKVSESWPHPRYLPDKLGLERQDNAAPWLCAQYHTQSFLPHGGVWGESHYGTHFGITVNSRQPPIHVQTWSSPPTQVSVQTSQAVWPKDEAHNIPFQSHPIAVSTLWPCSVTCKRRVGLIAFQLRNEQIPNTLGHVDPYGRFLKFLPLLC